MNESPEDNKFPMTVTETEDGGFIIEWDGSHPVTSIFNEWTEQDFINMLDLACRDALEPEIDK
jgi:hypothetical protein